MPCTFDFAFQSTCWKVMIAVKRNNTKNTGGCPYLAVNADPWDVQRQREYRMYCSQHPVLWIRVMSSLGNNKTNIFALGEKDWFVWYCLSDVKNTPKIWGVKSLCIGLYFQTRVRGCLRDTGYEFHSGMISNFPGGVLPNILDGGVPHGSQTPDPISDQNIWFFRPFFRPDPENLYPFSDLSD